MKISQYVRPVSGQLVETHPQACVETLEEEQCCFKAHKGRL